MTVEDALKTLGRDPAARDAVIAALQAYERLPANRFTTVRDDVTGPIVDALHADAGLVRKQLADGLVFEFPYRSKIARDFAMAVPERPDHVWEPQTTKLLVHFAGMIEQAIVGGAYFGDQAVPLARALRGRGSCHAFEPDPEQAAALRRNGELNGLDSLIVRPMGLWSEETRLSFVGEDALAATIASDEGIPATTIDAYASAEGIARLGLIMLDLEGGELPVLEGARETLARDGPFIVFEVHGSYVDWSEGLESIPIARLLASFGYSLFAVRDFQSNVDMRGRPIELVPAATVYLEGPPHGFNMLALRDSAMVESEPFAIVPGVSPKLLFHRDPALHHPIGGL
jgi:FkbM family methyltransferase